MSVSSETNYLEGATGALKAFFEELYTLLDGTTPGEAAAWVNMFTEDAEFHFPGKTYTGREEIRAQREEFSALLPGFKHRPLRVYALPTSSLDFVTINRGDWETETGAHTLHTAAEYQLVQQDGKYLVRKLVLHMDPAGTRRSGLDWVCEVVPVIMAKPHKMRWNRTAGSDSLRTAAYSKARYGRIIHTSPTRYADPKSGLAPCVMSKAGVVGLARAAAAEAGDGIAVNAVMPQLRDTGCVRAMDGHEKLVDMAIGKQAVKRKWQAWDVANSILFLASGEARYISG
ncbi:hypothetical protein BJX64DRAFT_291188 [Aspergillus heterothallicus]